MKGAATSILLLISLLGCYAQGAGKGLLEISAGPSFPFGDFDRSHTDTEGSGYANNGIYMALSFQYRLKTELALIASVSGTVLGVDESSLAEKYRQPEFGYDWTLESANWLVNAYLGGLDITLPLYRSDFYFRLLGGFAYTRLPGLTGSGYNFQRETSSDLAAAWSIGAGLKYQDFKKVTLSLGFDFFITNPVLDERWSSDIQAPGSATIYQNIVLFNVTAGLGLRIF